MQGIALWLHMKSHSCISCVRVCWGGVGGAGAQGGLSGGCGCTGVTCTHVLGHVFMHSGATDAQPSRQPAARGSSPVPWVRGVWPGLQRGSAQGCWWGWSRATPSWGLTQCTRGKELRGPQPRTHWGGAMCVSPCLVVCVYVQTWVSVHVCGCACGSWCVDVCGCAHGCMYMYCPT